MLARTVTRSAHQRDGMRYFETFNLCEIIIMLPASEQQRRHQQSALVLTNSQADELPASAAAARMGRCAVCREMIALWKFMAQ